MAVTHYRELIAWQRAMDMVEAVYRLTHSFAREELYGLTTQLRRAAVSVPSSVTVTKTADTEEKLKTAGVKLVAIPAVGKASEERRAWERPPRFR